jgi:glycerol-3-phosphate O-acyltransferase/dihydroxyacetone phosphate acyltransferase
MQRSLLRNALRAVFRRIARIYFREIEVAGAVPTAGTHGRIFGANHVNGLVDPVLVLTHSPCEASPIAKATLFSIPGLNVLLSAAGAVPIVRRRDNPDKSASDNDEVFARIAKHLHEGGNVLIFPEGTSHSEPHLVSLRSGAGRMLAAAKALGATGTSFQSVALEFEDRETFRSRALVLYGPVREVDALDKTGDALADAVTRTFAEDLSELLVEGRTWDERRLIARVTELYVNDTNDKTLARWNDVGRRAEHASKLLSAEPDVIADVRAKVDAYFTHLEGAALTDDVISGHANAGARRTALLLLLLPLALVGMVIYFAPYQLPRLVVRRTNPDRDVVSTYKLGVGLLAFPLWAALLVAAAWWRLPLAAAAYATALVLTGPFAALAWLDDVDALASRARVLLPGQARAAQARLREERATLINVLEALRARVEPS